MNLKTILLNFCKKNTYPSSWHSNHTVVGWPLWHTPHRPWHLKLLFCIFISGVIGGAVDENDLCIEISLTSFH